MMVPKPVTLVLPEYRDWIRQQPCVLAGEEPCTCSKYQSVNSRKVPVSACHVRTRRNNGDRENLYPGCGAHHEEQHRVGLKTFEARHGLNLRRIAKDLWARYQDETAWERGG